MIRTIAFVLPSLGAGGAERVALSLLEGVDRISYRPHLIAFEGGPLATDVPADVATETLGHRRLRQSLGPLLHALRRIRPQVIFSTLGYVNLALLALRPLLHGSPTIVVREANTPSTSLSHSRFGRTLGVGYRVLYPRSDLILCQSHEMLQELADDFGVPRERLAHLCNPVDDARLRAAAVPQRAAGPGRRFVVCGRLTHQKGIDRLLRLWPQMPDEDRLEVVGDGPDRAALVAQANEMALGGRIRWHGYVPRPWGWFAGADAVLVPSRWEGQSNVALEALACGTPVIATPEAGGIAEVASAAPAGSVTIAAMDDAYARAMLAVKARQPGVGPSLLPDQYRKSTVTKLFNESVARAEARRAEGR